MNNYNDKYADIINMPHHVSKKHPQMSLEARSAQFAPFVALTGLDDAIDETCRYTEVKKEINEELQEILNMKLQEIIKNKSVAKFTYFVPDKTKQGGRYVTVNGCIKKINEYKNIIVLNNDTIINISDIIKID